jgi:hypothetical protein
MFSVELVEEGSWDDGPAGLDMPVKRAKVSSSVLERRGRVGGGDEGGDEVSGGSSADADWAWGVLCVEAPGGC